MDKEIPKDQLRRERAARLLKWSLLGLLPVAAVILLSRLIFYPSVNAKDLTIGSAECGILESRVAATGRIVPLYELTITSPVTSRIMEVYHTEGDSVKAGESLLCLDLHSAEVDMLRMADEVSMKDNEIEQTRLNSATYLTDLEMRIKAKEMDVNHLKEEVANQRRLDSIGSGTGERIRQAELAYATGLLELEQMRVRLTNEQMAHAASYRSKQLEGSITRNKLRSMQRTLEDARIRAPHDGIVTYLNRDLGTSISHGEKLAVISDLSHFKIDAEISEGSAGKVAIGAPVNIRLGRHILIGKVSNITPQSKEGMVHFTVSIDDDSNSLLRSGLRTELDIAYDRRDGIIRIPNGPYFQGPGDYLLFIKTEDSRLERRSVRLGDSNFDFVEVISGIDPGEKVVVSDLSAHKGKSRLRLKE